MSASPFPYQRSKSDHSAPFTASGSSSINITTHPSTTASSASSPSSTASISTSGFSSSTTLSSTTTEPPRKRQRISAHHQESSTLQLDMDDNTCNDQMFHTSLDYKAERDKEYYFPEADCVVRVGGTLFKIHRFLLARDASAFHDMFCIPHDAEFVEKAQEGGSDANPIMLYGETEDEFRVLLSALYALPSELQAYATPEADISRLITISCLTNKYHFTSTSQWAISSLYHVLAHHSSPPATSPGSPLTSPISPMSSQSRNFGWDIQRLPEEYDLNTCSPELLARIMDVAMVCGHDELSALVECRWIDRLRDASSPTQVPGSQQASDRKPGYSHLDEAKWAVSVADRWEMKRLRGVAYYVCLIHMGDELSRIAKGSDEADYSTDQLRHDLSAEASALSLSSPVLVPHSPPPPLTFAQTSRLLLGHLSLTHLWDNHLHLQAPSIPAPSPGSCTYHQHGCMFTWVSAWREAARTPATLKHKSSDIIGRIRTMEKQLVGNDALVVALTPACRRRALGAVREMVKVLEEGLGDHFRGMIGSEL